ANGLAGGLDRGADALAKVLVLRVGVGSSRHQVGIAGGASLALTSDPSWRLNARVVSPGSVQDSHGSPTEPCVLPADLTHRASRSAAVRASPMGCRGPRARLAADPRAVHHGPTPGTL